jgi:ubiquitin-activating enzyme E1
MVSQGVSMLWSSFVGKKKVRGYGCARFLGGFADSKSLQSEERLPMRFSALVEHVTKKPIPSHVTHFVVEVMASDEDGEDVEVCIRTCFSCSSLIPSTCTGSLHRGAQVIVK